LLFQKLASPASGSAAGTPVMIVSVLMPRQPYIAS
jgi:hypothetical protein